MKDKSTQPFSILIQDLEVAEKDALEKGVEDIFDPEICPLFQAAKRTFGKAPNSAGYSCFWIERDLYDMDKSFTERNLDELKKGIEFHTTIKQIR